MSEPERFTFFWDGPFSQWHASRFSDDQGQQGETGLEFNCAEQFMMYSKAMLFGDVETAARVLAADHPSDQKKLGRQVRDFDAARWKAEARRIVYRGNRLKFTQDAALLECLMQTRGTTLVEASPHDRVWGIGLPADDPRALSRETWLGTNWLGEVLTRLRDDLADPGP